MERGQIHMSESCNFCKILSGKAQASIVCQDANILAFMDLNPANTGHTLVIPREHWETIYQIPEKALADLFAVVKKVSVAVKKAVCAEGISILQFNERVGGQSVKHFHVHVIPRFRGDAISKLIGSMLGPLEFKKAERGDLDKIAKKIRENL
jgi:histidine triad (HIT) family protein